MISKLQRLFIDELENSEKYEVFFLNMSHLYVAYILQLCIERLERKIGINEDRPGWYHSENFLKDKTAFIARFYIVYNIFITSVDETQQNFVQCFLLNPLCDNIFFEVCATGNGIGNYYLIK